MVATLRAQEKDLNAVEVTIRDFHRKSERERTKTANENTWKTSPASRMLLGVLGFLYLEYATPMSAEPTI